MRAKGLILLICLAPSAILGSKLKLNGAGSQIRLNGAYMTAGCEGANARVAYFSPRISVAGGTVKAFLAGVSGTCYGLDLTVPCASSGEIELERPKTLYCTFFFFGNRRAGSCPPLLRQTRHSACHTHSPTVTCPT